MTEKNKNLLATIKVSTVSKSHIKIENKDVCAEKCNKKYCTTFCPSNVFNWSRKEKEIIIDHKRCIECLACPFACPYQNIYWKFPPSGYGVEY